VTGRLRVAITVIAAATLAIGVFLTWERHQGGSVPCPVAGGGCTTVQNSRYATFAGVPVAVLGILGSLALLATTLSRRGEAVLVAFAITAIGAAFSLYLTWLEAYRIDAYCIYCLTSMALWVLAAAITGIAAARADGNPA
jgi:uncharacterized membrane protein